MLLRIVSFYGLTWFFLILLGGIQQGTGFIPREFGLAQWGPGIAALVMNIIFRKDGHKIILFNKDTPVMRYLYAALIPLAVGLVLFLIRSWTSIQAPASQPAFGALWLVSLWVPIGALGEELGWRGYLHKYLDPRMLGLFSSILVGLLWMPIHIHFFAQGPVFLAFFTLQIIAYSIVIYALVHDTGFSVLLATIFHLSINLTSLLFLDVLYATSFMVISGIIWICVGLFVIALKRDIFFTSKSTL